MGGGVMVGMRGGNGSLERGIIGRIYDKPPQTLELYNSCTRGEDYLNLKYIFSNIIIRVDFLGHSSFFYT